MKSIADINAIREQMQSKVLIRDNTKEGIGCNCLWQRVDRTGI